MFISHDGWKTRGRAEALAWLGVALVVLRGSRCSAFWFRAGTDVFHHTLLRMSQFFRRQCSGSGHVTGVRLIILLAHHWTRRGVQPPPA